MIWHWVTFFSLSAAAVCLAQAPGELSGRVEVTSSTSRPGVNREGAGNAAGVVAWLEPVSGKAPPTPPQTASIAHEHKTFVPHVLAVRLGSKVRFPNLDPFFHNAFSNYDGQVFDVGLRPPRSSPEITFHRPGVVHLFCNIHPTMSAIIMVLDTPWFAVTNAQGAFRIEGVPPGVYRLKVFHERALPEVLDKLERHVTIGPGSSESLVISISETGYVAPPHQNKYGKGYPPVIVDQYPGGKR
jgi:plastocyanin